MRVKEEASEATVIRDIKRINGRPPRKRDRTDRSGCTDPNPLSPEPLTFLLPAHRGEYRFTSVRQGKEKERHIDRPVDVRVPVKVQARYGLTAWVVLDRDDETIRFRPVAFRDPEEVLLLPQSIESLTLLRGACSRSAAPRPSGTTSAF